VVKTQGSSPDQIPNRNLPVTILKELYGNFVIVEIARGKYAIYCHLKPGSVAVKMGERVHVGQPLAKLGNSGNSTAPHLHFQISDAPSVVDADSLPFVFNRMYYRMRIAGPIFPTVDKMTESALVARFDRTGAGWREFEMPLQGDVVDFR
jgi:murein DD-endopeptidase MepM/ murein hydrolase activator NlpD